MKWEYIIKSDASEAFDLNILGEQGWELISVVPEIQSNIIFGGSDTVKTNYIFKRPKQDEGERKNQSAI